MKNSSINLAGNTRNRDSSLKVNDNYNKLVTNKVISMEPSYSTSTIRNQPAIKNTNNIGVKLGSNNNYHPNNIPKANNNQVLNNYKNEVPIVYKPPIGIRSLSQATYKKPNVIPTNNYNDNQINTQDVYSSNINNLNHQANYNYCNSVENGNYNNSYITNYQFLNNKHIPQNEILKTDAIYLNESDNNSIFNKVEGKPYNYNNNIEDDKSVKSGLSGITCLNNRNNFDISHDNINDISNNNLNKSNLNESNLNKSDISKSMVKRNLQQKFNKNNELELMPENVRVFEKETKLRSSKTPNMISPLNTTNNYCLNTCTVANQVNSSNKLNSNNSQQTIKNSPNVYVRSTLKINKNTSNNKIGLENNNYSHTIEIDKNLTREIQSIPTENTTIVSQVSQYTGYSLNTNKPTNILNEINNHNYSNYYNEYQTTNFNNDNYYVNIEDLMLIEEKLIYIINLFKFLI